MNLPEVMRLVPFSSLGWGSLKVNQMSATSPGPKNWSMNSMRVRRKATLDKDSWLAVLAPRQNLWPLMSTPMKLRLGHFRAKPTVYSPLPHPSSKVMGLSFLNTALCHCPL